MTLSPEILNALKDFQAWRSGNTDIDLMDFLGFVATPDLLFAFLALLCPELHWHQGNYFIASRFDPKTYDDWMGQLHDPVEVQKVMNHIHLATLFQDQAVSGHVAREAAQKIADLWSKLFRDKGLVAKAYGDTLEDAELTLFKDESAGCAP